MAYKRLVWVDLEVRFCFLLLCLLYLIMLYLSDEPSNSNTCKLGGPELLYILQLYMDH